MFASNSQVGRTRVNKIREGKKRPPKSRELNVDDHLVHIKPRSSIEIPKNKYKVIGQLPKKNVTGVDKLMQLQQKLVNEGYSVGDYKDYIQEKINNDKYYYKTLSDEDISKLHKRYRLLVQKRDNQYNKLGDEKRMNRKQRKLYREKRKNLVDERKRELINKLFVEINRSNAGGITHNCNLLKDDPDNWNNTKMFLFIGGKYIESYDKAWIDIYSKIVSPNTSNIFDMNDQDDMYKYIMNQ
jgi:hypothetical protein